MIVFVCAPILTEYFNRTPNIALMIEADIVINMADNKKTTNLCGMGGNNTGNYWIRINFYLLVLNQALLIFLYLQELEHSSLSPLLVDSLEML